MPLTSHLGVGVAALVLAATTGGGGSSRRGEADMKSWESSRSWKRYKSAFEEIGGVKSIGRLGRIEDEAAEIEAALPREFPERSELARALAASLRDRIEARRRGLQTPRGRLPRPDWKAQLAEAVERLSHDCAALDALRAGGVRDAWVTRSFLPAARWSRDLVRSRIELVEKDLPGDAEAAELARRARSRVESAAATLGD